MEDKDMKDLVTNFRELADEFVNYDKEDAKLAERRRRTKQQIWKLLKIDIPVWGIVSILTALWWVWYILRSDGVSSVELVCVMFVTLITIFKIIDIALAFVYIRYLTRKSDGEGNIQRESNK